ncbi:hypothetical protein CCYA_CCYA03G1022 [Cyanidiococcus yangmingshanensis]|nr:hypothetical protein CCYA_CCYA03G1022 [Cyanidiococcus yangmingshanensis]
MPFRGSYIDTTTPRALPLLQQVYRKLRPADLGAAARWSLLVGVTAFWFIEPYDWLRSTFMTENGGEKSPKLK